ncbi:MAG: protein-glutamate O-methyltransferase CheR [bacterium]|nr:protein-glutamate O-methyltransferase CheR [bacterium]
MHWDPRIRPIHRDEFRLFQALIYREAGIFLSREKKELLVARLTRRLRTRGLRSFGAYYQLVKGDDEERAQMLDCICTNESHFFREPHHFEFLERELFPAWAASRRRRIRVWSAGCSTGEEPYSLAMTLLSHFPGWWIEILATDLSTRALTQARSALWPLKKAKDIPPRYLKRFMLRGIRQQDGNMKAGPELRSLVRFERLNLSADELAPDSVFDLIFCRNVLIYFDSESRRRALDRILKHLAANGYFFLGHAESLSGINYRLRGVLPSVYGRRP